MTKKKAGMTNVIRLHDTRHTFASQFMMHGGNVFTLQKLLGHKSVNMTMKYAHLADDYLKDAVGIISFSGEEKTDLSPKRGIHPASSWNLRIILVPAPGLELPQGITTLLLITHLHCIVCLGRSLNGLFGMFV
jgi:hypothetical protein